MVAFAPVPLPPLPSQILTRNVASCLFFTFFYLCILILGFTPPCLYHCHPFHESRFQQKKEKKAMMHHTQHAVSRIGPINPMLHIWDQYSLPISEITVSQISPNVVKLLFQSCSDILFRVYTIYHCRQTVLIAQALRHVKMPIDQNDEMLLLFFIIRLE